MGPRSVDDGLVFFFLSKYKHKVENIVQLGYNATSAHVICIFPFFPFFFFFFPPFFFYKTSDVAGRQYDVEAAFYFVECILLTNNIDEKATVFAKIKSNNKGTVNY